MHEQAAITQGLTVEDIAMLCKRLCEKLGISESEVDSLGIASPGVVDDATGEMIYANGDKYEGEWSGDLINGKGVGGVSRHNGHHKTCNHN